MADHTPRGNATSMASLPDKHRSNVGMDRSGQDQAPARPRFRIPNHSHTAPQEHPYRQASSYQQASSYWQEDSYQQANPYQQGAANPHQNSYQQAHPYQQRDSYQHESLYQQGGPYRQENPYQQGNSYHPGAAYQQTSPYHQGVPYYEENPYQQENPYRHENPHQQTHHQRIPTQRLLHWPNQEEHHSRTKQRESQVDRTVREGVPRGVQGEGYMHQRHHEATNVDSGAMGSRAIQGFTQQLPIRTQSQVQFPAKPQQHEQQLPEPALTAALPKQRAALMPAVNQQELSSLISTAEQYLAVLRLNQNAHNMQLARPATANAKPSSHSVVPSLPSLNPSRNDQFENPLQLPGVTKKLLAEMEAKKKAYKRKLQASKEQEAQVTTNEAAQHGMQVMNTRAPPRNGPQPGARMPTTRGISGPQGRILKSTPKSVRPHRLKLRGPSNGYNSFGDLVQVDMPSSSLEHFSITKMSRTANEHYIRTPVYHRPEPRFNIFQEIIKRPELVITLASHLRVQELLILYSICRSFHNIVNQRFTTVVLSQAVRRAPESMKIFPFRCYSNLCIDDPGERPHPIAQRAAAGQHRKVPSFRWLLMICFREMVCHEIRIIMAEDGTPLPEQCESVMKKIWFMMDIPNSVRRIGMVQNLDVFTDADLFFATLLFVKMDMRFTDPVTGSGRDGMRRMLLSQPSLSTFWKALRRSALVTKMDAMKIFIRWKWQPPARLAGQSVFGVPPNEIGMMQYEGWGRTGSRVRLQRPDEIILKESIRRGLGTQVHYTDMFMWGYVNPRTLQNMPPVPERRNLERLEGMEELLIPRADRKNRSVGKPVSKMIEFH